MGLPQGLQVNYDNVTNDKYLGEYLDIHRAFGRPKIVDEMIQSRFDYDPFLRDAIYTAALQIEKVWKEEEVREFVLRMSWHIMHLEETLKRNNISHEPYRSYYNMPKEEEAHNETKD
jgi:hypothetical protein